MRQSYKRIKFINSKGKITILVWRSSEENGQTRQLIVFYCFCKMVFSKKIFNSSLWICQILKFWLDQHLIEDWLLRWEPWSSRYSRRLMIERLWVRIPVLHTWWIILTVTLSEESKACSRCEWKGRNFNALKYHTNPPVHNFDL